MRAHVFMSGTVIVKKDCILANISFSVPQSILRRSGQNLFSLNAVRKNELGWSDQYYCDKPVAKKTFFKNPSQHICMGNP